MRAMLNMPLSEDVVEADTPAVDARRPQLPSSSAPIERHGYHAPASRRLYGGIGTTMIFAAILAGAVITLDRIDLRKPAPPPLVVTMLPEAPPRPPEPIRVEIQKPAEKPAHRVEPTPAPIPSPPPLIPLPTVQAPAAVAQRPAVDPRPRPAEVTPPLPAPAPAASHGPDRWESRVIAKLQHFADTIHGRQRGMTYVRFRVDRGGHVLSAAIDQSSGSPVLDAAAMETLRRADPLPKIPADRPDTIELVVPIGR
jgi:protein TonB